MRSASARRRSPALGRAAELCAPVIGIASGKTTAGELSAAGADVVRDSLEDVPRLVDVIAATTLGRV